MHPSSRLRRHVCTRLIIIMGGLFRSIAKNSEAWNPTVSVIDRQRPCDRCRAEYHTDHLRNMVKPLGLAKFYDRSLPRPRIYTDVKFSSKRIDPPPLVLESLMKWANDAHWSMGDLCLDRKRIQGKIEGSVKKLRAQKEEEKKKAVVAEMEMEKEEEQSANGVSGGNESTANVTPPMEPHHVVLRPLVEDETPDFVPDSYRRPSRRRSPRVPSRVRKLGGVFEQQASQKKGSAYVAKRKLSPELEVFDWIPVPDKFTNVSSRRTSPRKKDRHRSSAAEVGTAAVGRSEGSVRRNGRLSASLAISEDANKVSKKAPAPQ